MKRQSFLLVMTDHRREFFLHRDLPFAMCLVGLSRFFSSWVVQAGALVEIDDLWCDASPHMILFPCTAPPLEGESLKISS